MVEAPGPQAGPAGATLPLDRPVFIVGDGRSGTTLMRSMLSAHPRLAVTPETQYLARAAAAGDLTTGTPRSFDEFWRDYISWVRFEDLGVDPADCMALVDRQGRRSFETVFAAVLAAYLHRVGKARVGEKSPGHVRYLEVLFRWFPDAQVIVLRRDPRAVVASKMRTPWVADQIRPPSLRTGVISTSRWHAFVAQVENWAEIYEEILPAWRDHPRVLTVDYEELVLRPEEQVRAVCDFLGEAYDPAMIDGRSGATVPPPAGTTPDERLESWRREHEERALSAVSADSVERWRHELSPFEVATIEARCAAGMARAGHAPTAPTVRRRFAGAAGRLTRELARAEVRTLPLFRRGARFLRRAAQR